MYEDFFLNIHDCNDIALDWEHSAVFHWGAADEVAWNSDVERFNIP